MKHLKRLLIVSVACALWCAAPLAATHPAVVADTLPDRLTDEEFWGLTEAMSEPDGSFRSENLVGNERPLQRVVPRLKAMPRGGVYLGVAPDQNFTYIVALEPKIAFIVDIRRGNLRQHLMYKALFELSADRAEFVSRLFTKKRPAGLTANSTAGDIMNAYWDVVTSPQPAYDQNLKDIEDLLTKKHGFRLTADDLKGLEYIYYNFYWYGPSITYTSNTGGNGGNMPNYADMMMGKDDLGAERGYLSSEATFQAMKALESKNLLVPVVGNFAGPKALRAVGKYLTDHGATVSAFYVSNVEQYLFMDNIFGNFYENVGTLPLTDQSVFIRSAAGTNKLDPIKLLVKDYTDGRIRSYSDVTIRGQF